MTRFPHELLIFIVFLRIVLQTCASIPEYGEEQLEFCGCMEDEIDFTQVGSENNVSSSEGPEESPMIKSVIIRGSYGSAADVTTVEGGSFFDSIFSDRLGSSYGLGSKFFTEDVEIVEGDGDIVAFELAESKEQYSDFVTSTVISETVSVDENELISQDCFNGRAVHHFSLDWIRATFIPFIQSGNQLLPGTLEEILEFVEQIFTREPAIMDIAIEFGEELIVVGDIHGQFDDLVRIFEQNGYPSPQRKFIFNGDIIDRGSNSIGCLMTLFLMKIYFPSSVFITRGNHESHTCGDGTFKEECFERILEPLKFFLKCHEVFNVLPLGYTIQNRFFVCHGGLPDDFDLNFIKDARKPRYTPEQQFLLMSMLWNDPHDGFGMRESKRGGSTLSFGKDVTFDFLQRHNFNLLIRSHEYHMDGFFFMHDGSCLTIFSAPNYCGLCNKGTVMKIKPDLSYEIVEIVTPKVVENSVLKRTKERSWTLNLAEAEEDAVIIFPINKKIEETQKSSDSSSFSWSGLFTFKK